MSKILRLKETAADAWWGGEIHVPPALDDAFGIANNKQGIHPKSYVKDYLIKALKPTISRLRQTAQQRRKEQRERRHGGKPTFTETRAAEAEKLLAAAYTVPTDPAYLESVEQVIREFAKTHCREGESPEIAYERIKNSRYLLEFEHSPEGPFYRVDSFGPRVVVYVNSAHAFYDQIWEPLGNSVRTGDGNGEAEEGDPLDYTEESKTPQAALAMLLLSLGRVELGLRSRSDEAAEFFKTIRAEWSTTLRTFLNNLN
jgi:hypothetical protein